MPDLFLKVGTAEVLIGQGCHDQSACYPEEFAWIRASACLPAQADTTLEAQRVAEGSPLVLLPMEAHATGNPSCPYRALGYAEFWMGLVDSPVDCVRGSVVSSAGVLASRAACFSDL